MQPIYLDYNATTPVAPEVLQAMLPYFSEKFGNPASSTHAYGWIANDAIKKAQETIAESVGCEAQQLVFTSGSTEAINLAIKGVFELYSPHKGKHIITCETEHRAVLDVCEYLEKFHQATITYLSVNKDGLIDLKELEQAITEKTILVSIMHANNETGVIQDIQSIADIVHANNSILMSDCTQSVGKIPFHIDSLGIDICCFSAHKYYGPKGVGALFYRRRSPRVSMQPLIHGGKHQRGMRSGTLNVPLIVGMSVATQLAISNQKTYYNHTVSLRNQLEQSLTEITDCTILSNQANRLPNTTNCLFHNIDGTKLIELINGAVAVSTGSACTSSTLTNSHVINAMIGNDEASSIRFSLGKTTTISEINQTIQTIKNRIE